MLQPENEKAAVRGGGYQSEGAEHLYFTGVLTKPEIEAGKIQAIVGLVSSPWCWRGRCESLLLEIKHLR